MQALRENQIKNNSLLQDKAIHKARLNDDTGLGKREI